MEVNDLVLVQGIRDTRTTLSGWSEDRWRIVGQWFLGALVVAALLLASVWFVAAVSRPDPTPLAFPGLTDPADLGDLSWILYGNSLVLALHALACVAGFIAGSSLPLSAEHRTGFSRWVHERAGPLAIAFVVGATLFSLGTQAYALGGKASTLAAQLQLSPEQLLVLLLPHALPELVALFLPLAAWIIASRRDQWHELLAATFVTVAIAGPTLVAAALVELYVTPRILEAAIA
jgi:hypothetical protein